MANSREHINCNLDVPADNALLAQKLGAIASVKYERMRLDKQNEPIDHLPTYNPEEYNETLDELRRATHSNRWAREF